MVPDWLHIGSETSLVIALLSALGIVADEFRRPQKMWIMNLIWPLCALFGSLVWLGVYLRHGRMPEPAARKTRDRPEHRRAKAIFDAAVVRAASHCGSGCTLGDICAEGLLALAPGLAVAFGLGSVFQDRIFAGWVLDFILAYAFGIVFQYFTIAPMRHLAFWPGLWAAIKADTLSLIAWQVGMYAFMAVAHFWLFGGLLHTGLRAAMPEFWFMMQIAMICGFITSYPVNAFLLKSGLKERM